MKRLLFFLSFIALVAGITYSCERDDICAETTATTPRLIIEFYDTDERDELKNVPRITVYGEALFLDENGDLIEPEEASDSIIIAPDETNYLFNFNSNKAELPLKVEETPLDELTTVRYVLEKDTNLRLDTDDPETSNIDILEIKYRTEFKYVSRACGYKSIFNNLSVVKVNDDNSWIAGLEIEESIELTIENENTTHVRIYH